jgi:hypothetical protein
MRTNPFYDAWLFLTGSTGEHEASGVGWLLTVLYLALLIASIAIAYSNWRQDASQRTMGHVANWFMRVMIGTMWYQGSIWKLPLPVAGGFRAAIAPMSQYAAFDFFKWIVNNIFLHILPVLGPLVFLTEMLLAVSYKLLLGSERLLRIRSLPACTIDTLESCFRKGHLPLGPVIVTYQVSRFSFPRECLNDLLRQPLHRRVPGCGSHHSRGVE